MQFSLRRMLLAVAVFAATIGVLTLNAKRWGMFRSENDPTWWWVTATVTAFAASGMLLLVHRHDLRRIRNVIVWIAVGMLIGAILSANFPPECAIPGGAVGGLIGCILSRPSHPLRTSPDNDPR